MSLWLHHQPNNPTHRVDYLTSLGKAQTAAVKRDADIGVAEANRDAGIREAECERAHMDSKFMADTKIANRLDLIWRLYIQKT